MEVKLNIEYQQLLELIRQLPVQQITQLKEDIESSILPKPELSENSSLQEVLLNAPTITDEEYDSYLEARKRVNTWRTK